MNASADRIVQGLAGVSGRVFPWIRRMLEAWGRTAKNLWGRPNVLGKVFAAAWVLGGIVVMAYCAYFLVLLIPILLLVAFIAAVLASIGGTRPS